MAAYRNGRISAQPECPEVDAVALATIEASMRAALLTRLRKYREALGETADALDSLWAAIGDRLLAKGPLSKGYANKVASEVRAAEARARALSRKTEVPRG